MSVFPGAWSLCLAWMSCLFQRLQPQVSSAVVFSPSNPLGRGITFCVQYSLNSSTWQGTHTQEVGLLSPKSKLEKQCRNNYVLIANNKRIKGHGDVAFLYTSAKIRGKICGSSTQGQCFNSKETSPFVQLRSMIL